MRDYYETLGIDKTADASDIKSAYRKLAMKYHPDRNQDDSKAEERFKEVRQAYSVLSDPGKRRTYDRFGEAGVKANGANGATGGFSGGINLDDVFGDIFGSSFSDVFGGGRNARSGVSRGRDQEVVITLDFMEAVNGGERKIKVPTIVGCKPCNGSGAEPGSTPQTCRHCGGRGQVSGGQGFFSVVQTCPYCRGRGQVIEKPCHSCQGQGRVRDTRNLTLKIPAGIDNGMRIRLAGGGESGGPGAPPGDLYVAVRVKEHSLFRRDGHDLHLDVVVPITTAVLGGEVEVPSVRGKLKLKIPQGTQNNMRLRLRDEGIWFEHNNEKGDLICSIRVEIPVKLTKEQKELFEQLEQSLTGSNHRHQPHRRTWLDEVKGFFNSLGG